MTPGSEERVRGSGEAGREKGNIPKMEKMNFF